MMKKKYLIPHCEIVQVESENLLAESRTPDGGESSLDIVDGNPDGDNDQWTPGSQNAKGYNVWE